MTALNDDRSLAAACASGDPDALRRFERECVAPLHAFIARVDPNPAFISEVLQRLRVKLLTGTPPAICGFKAQGPLTSWVRVVASRLAVDLLRERAPEPVDAPSSLEVALAGDVERELLHQRYGALLHQALRQAFDSLSAREKAVLKLHSLERAGIDRIATVYAVHRATAARWLESIRTALRERTLAALDRELVLTGAEAHSLVRTLLSNAGVSLERHLTADALSR